MNQINGRQENPVVERTLLEGLLHYLSILLKYRWLIILITGAAAAASIAFCVASLVLPVEKSPLPNVYTATGVVLVQKGMGDTLSASLLASLGVGTPSRLMDAGTTTTAGFDTGALLILVLRSRTVIDDIIEEFKLIQKYGMMDQAKSKTRTRVLAKSHFDYSRATATLKISYEDVDPILARDVTNRMVELLNGWYAQNMSSSNLKQMQLLEEKAKEVKTDINKFESRLKDLQKKYGVLTAQDLGTSQAATLASLRAQMILKEIEIKNYSTISAIEDPKLQQLREELQNINDLISRFQQGVPSIQDSTADSISLPDVQMQFNNITAELNIQQSIYNTLSQQYEVMKRTSEPERSLQILELAEVPDSKSGPRRTQIIFFATFIAFAISVSFALLLNGLAQIRHKPANKPLLSKEK